MCARCLAHYDDLTKKAETEMCQCVLALILAGIGHVGLVGEEEIKVVNQ